MASFLAHFSNYSKVWLKFLKFAFFLPQITQHEINGNFVNPGQDGSRTPLELLMEMEGVKDKDCSCSGPQEKLLGEEAIGELSDDVFEPPPTPEAPEEAQEDGGKKELVKDR